MWNIYSPSLWETACNLICTQLRIVYYATMYQSQSVCISRSGFRETGCFYETCCLCAPTSCDGVAPWASDFRPPHTMDTVGRVHWLKRVTYNATSQHCTWSQNLQCNITTLHCTWSQNLQVMGHTSASPLSYLTKCQHSSLSKSQISPKSSSTPCLCERVFRNWLLHLTWTG